MGNFLTIPKAHVQAPAEDGFQTAGHGKDYTSKLMVKVDGIQHGDQKQNPSVPTLPPYFHSLTYSDFLVPTTAGGNQGWFSVIRSE